MKRINWGQIPIKSYIVATDGIMHDLADVPRGTPGWATDNPTFAANVVLEYKRI